MSQTDVIESFEKLRNSIEKQLKQLGLENTEENLKKMSIAYNSRVVISSNKVFLESLKNDIGGEIINDDELGVFLYLEILENSSN